MDTSQALNRITRLTHRGRDWVAAQASTEVDRWPLWLSVGLGGGVGLYFSLGAEPDWLIGPAGVAMASAVFALGARRWPAATPVMAVVVAIALGFLSAQIRTWSVAAPRIERQIGPVAVTGQAVEVETRPDSIRIVLSSVLIRGTEADATPERVRLVLRGVEAVPVPGQWLAMRAILSPPPPPVLPGAYDNGRALFFDRIGAVGFAIERPTPIDPPAGHQAGGDLLDHLAVWRHVASIRIRDALPGPPGALAAALMTGDRSGLSEQDNAALRDSGLAHILSISGLHFALVAGTLFFIFRALLAAWPAVALRYPIKKWAAIAAFLGASGYFLFAIPSVPSARSFLMLGLVLIGVLVDRVALTLRPCALAAAAILLVQPESLLGPSFQMSFAAVIALIAAYESLAPRISAWRRPGGIVRTAIVYLGSIALTSIIAGAATAPFGIYHFNRLATFGLVANLIAVPVLAAWVMPLLIIAFVLMPLGLESWALAAMGWGNDAILGAARWVAEWQGAALTVPSPSIIGLASATLGGLWLCLWRQPWRHMGWLGIGAGLASILAYVPPDILVSGNGRLFAVRGADGSLAFSSARVRSFDAEIWRRRDGIPESGPLWPRSGTSEDGRLSCDDLGCVYRARGHAVALVRDGRALDDDCRSADIIVAVIPVRRGCPSASLVVDRFDLWRHGAHAIYLDGGRRIVSVRDWQGERPWTARPERASRNAAGPEPRARSGR
ncbi:MAG: ComEC/Rec2 family competence protein [Alphaproteobacteria bacterium]